MTTYRVPAISSAPATNDAVEWNGSLWVPKSFAERAAKLLTTGGDLLYASGPGTANRLPIGSLNQVLLAYGGIPVWRDGAKLRQVAFAQYSTVNTTTSIIPVDNTLPQSTEGAQFMSLLITPKYNDSMMLVLVNMMVSLSTSQHMVGALFKDSETDARAVSIADSDQAGRPTSLTIMYLLASVGSTSAITWKVRAGPGAAATLTLNGQAGARRFLSAIKSSMYAIEFLF